MTPNVLENLAHPSCFTDEKAKLEANSEWKAEANKKAEFRAT